MNVDDETINLACNGLQNAIEKYRYCKKRKRKPSEQIDKIVQHACHCLRQLTFKRRSLEHGLQALQQCWTKTWKLRINNNSTDASSIAQLLTHVFHQYLRLRDGMNLMTSGECRHSGDVQESQGQKKYFRSNLPQLSTCGDGYTQLYTSQHYSGYGWDELFDPKVGVLHRLQQALAANKSNTWEKLLEYGAQTFESCLDQHETACQALQSQFEDLRKTIVRDLSRVCTKVEMTTRDKMETLHVTLKQGGTSISLQRRAGDFQVHDTKGCLPNEWTVQDWQRAMEYGKHQQQNVKSVPSSNKSPTRKKRRIMKKNHAKKESANGLLVAVKEKKISPIKNEESDQAGDSNRTVDNISLAQLKGDEYAKALEESREVLEAENEGGNSTLLAENVEDDVSELKQNVDDSRAKVERIKRVVTRVQRNQDEFDEELWDARECLREARMTLGSNLLSLCAVDKDSETYGENLAEARHSFKEALDLVKKQESVHDAICKQTNDEESQEARAIRRKLLLLRGRAHVNFGIALVELSRVKCPEPVRKSLEKEAFDELESAEGCADSIRARAVIDESKGASRTEIASDRSEANQLEALTNRWLANSLWHQRKRSEAVAASEKGSRFFVDGRGSVVDEDLRDIETELGIECFYACTSLADLALDELERLQIVVQGHPKRQDCLAKGEELFSVALQAYKRASLISSNLQKLLQDTSDTATPEALLQSNGILTALKIEKSMEQMKSWWEEKKLGKVLCLKDGSSKQSGSSQPRNDLFSSGPLRPNNGNTPVKRFTVNESSARRAKRRNQGGNGFSGPSTTASRTSSGQGGRSSSSTGIRYRKWGDELLPQVKSASGEMVPLIAYPACAPELPPGLTPFKPNQ